MLIPVRCFTCNKVVGNKYEKYKKLINEDGLSKKDALDQLGLVRYCCRTIILSHVELIDKVLNYSEINKMKITQE